MYRGRTERSFDDYETNAYLPLDIIPGKGSLDFEPANTACTRCHRLFPREEFSVTQLRKREQKCRVCKEIKRLADVQKNREDNWDEGLDEFFSGDVHDTCTMHGISEYSIKTKED